MRLSVNWSGGVHRADNGGVLQALLATLLTAIAGLAGLTLAELAHAGTTLEQIELHADRANGVDPSVPTAPLLSHLVAAPNQAGVMNGLVLPMTAQLNARVLLKERLQVFDPRWSTQAVFVVGMDNQSLNWLQRNHEQLVALHAVGLVDGLPSVGAFKTMQSLADGLPLAPLTGTWFHQRLRLAGADLVPLLILADGSAVQRVPPFERTGAPQ